MNFRSFIFISLPFMCFIMGYLLCSWYLGNQTYPTPDLIGLSVHEALLKTSPLHLNLQLIAQKEHPATPPGTIIGQKPIPNRRIKQHQSILISISKSPDIITAPDAAKMSKTELQQWSKKYAINLKGYSIPSTLPNQHFLAQYPSLNEIISHQTLIVYYAQNQPHLLLMPDFYHQKLDHVLSVLEQYQLTAEIFYKNESIKKVDQFAYVTAQKPTPATIIDIDKKPIIQLEVALEN